MTKENYFLETLHNNGVSFFVGVPDSTLSGLTALIDDLPSTRHIIAANEGGAVGLALGYNLATGKCPAIYMQNSGLGNAINPLVSLSSKEVCSLASLLIIGWRGHAPEQDEPQHRLQGKITPKILQALDIPYRVIGPNHLDWEAACAAMVSRALNDRRPCALLVEPATFTTASARGESSVKIKREAAIASLLSRLPNDTSFISTTGKTSREIFELRKSTGSHHDKDFLCVGGMGHANQIAAGVAIFSKAPVCCIDGDGALLMHMGGMAIISTLAPKNLIHCVINNGVHESVGAQPIGGKIPSFCALSEALGYATSSVAESEQDIEDWSKTLAKLDGPHFLEILCEAGSRPDLGRPTIQPDVNARRFALNLQAVQETEIEQLVG